MDYRLGINTGTTQEWKCEETVAWSMLGPQDCQNVVVHAVCREYRSPCLLVQLGHRVLLQL
jgi:hypothetical protein